MPYYTVHHVTRFTYASPVRESVMEVRVCPRDDPGQQVLEFSLSVSPRTRVEQYRDFLGNHVYHFDIPGTHMRQVITAQAAVWIDEATAASHDNPGGSWDDLEQMIASDIQAYEFTLPSHFVHTTKPLKQLAKQIAADRAGSPLETAAALCEALPKRIDYRPAVTAADSPIDQALASGAGVCQDFAHIYAALARRVGLPARYISGYLSRDAAQHDGQADATHAWVEVLIPGRGWAAFDPTHGRPAGDAHIRTAIGRDYADVPPTRGVYRGNAEGQLEVAVRVNRLDSAPFLGRPTFEVTGWSPPEPLPDLPDDPKPFEYYAQQMQQQQMRASR